MRPVWKGSISFGLVNVPIALYPAESKRDDVTFKLLDRRSMSPIHNKRVSEGSGEEVPWEEVVKGYEFEKGRFVVVDDVDFREANKRMTQTVEIVDFVDAPEIDPMYFEKPYFVAPAKGGAKGYALLRQGLQETGKIAIGKVVIRTREHLAAIIARGPVLILEILRFAYELREPKDLELPEEDPKSLGIRPAEIDLAKRLIEGMAQEWNPKSYHDEYRDDLLKMIERKVRSGGKNIHEMPEGEEEIGKAGVIDMMSLLKKSIKEEETKERRPRTAKSPVKPPATKITRRRPAEAPIRARRGRAASEHVRKSA